MRTAASLSQNKGVGLDWGDPSSARSCLSHMASVVAEVRALYSASQEDNVITSCFLLFQQIGEPASLNSHPEVDFLVPVQPAKSESAKPSK